MTTNRPGTSPNRRKGPDLWARSIRWLAVTVWILMIFALVIIDKAKPQVETFFDRYYNLRLRTTWDMELAHFIFYFMIAGLLLSTLGLVINVCRHRRRDDEYLISLFVAASISATGIVLYLRNF